MVQCKHYADYDTVYRILKREEVSKVERLRPKRYILVLSTPLTPKRKDAIFALFSPYCHGPEDIFGREDVNNLLGRHSAVEANHIKLWLASEAMLRRFLNHGIWGDSELTLERIRQQARRYVPNPSLSRAKEILNDSHYCIIVGIPGIGKTTLAEILLIDYADRLDFQAIRIANDLSEIKAVKDPRRRQIFYYDDFLGTAKLDKLEKNEDKRIMEFLQQVAANKRWRFILTTREYILNTAKIRYESLAHPPVELTPCIVDLADYTRPIRGLILYNHIYFSDLPDPYKRALLEGKRYSKILAHPNYNPRIVEHMTQYRNAARVEPQHYFEEFIRSLENPKRIWDHAFRNDLSEGAQHVLLVLGSMPTPVLLDDLRSAFEAFYKYRRKKLGFIVGSRDFEHALRELDGNFVKTDLVGKDQVIDFHNPSVNDYVDNYLAGSPDDVGDLIRSATFFDQLRQLWSGEGGRRFTGVDKYSDAFVSALARNFDAPTCRVRPPYGLLAHAQWYKPSFEQRMQFVVEVGASLKTAAARSLVIKLSLELGRRIKARSARKEGLVSLLPTLDRRTKVSKGVFAAAKQFLTQTLDDLDDFSSVANFVEKFPDVIDDCELRRIGSEFKEFSKDYADVTERDPDVLRSVADDITGVGEKLHVDVSDFADPLTGRAEQIESERESEPEPDDSGRDWVEETSAIRDVDVMFESLLQEITERAL